MSRPKEFVALTMGRSGVGKSTVVYTVLGLSRKDPGYCATNFAATSCTQDVQEVSKTFTMNDGRRSESVKVTLFDTAGFPGDTKVNSFINANAFPCLCLPSRCHLRRSLHSSLPRL